MMDVSAARTAPITTLVPDLDALVAKVMAEWHVPGLALAVLRRDAPPLLQAFGLTDIETGTRVETTTLFPIGSITKSFTATGLALLVDEGKLDWDVLVREILAEFKLKDAVANEKCTLRDLLTHRTGLPRHDWVHMPGHLDNAGMLAALRHLDPSREFRSAFQYQNLMYLVAGMVAERIAGQRWEDFTRARILDPLGMADTTTSLEEMVSEHTNHAAPHIFQENMLSRMPVRPIHTRPSGSICASIADMASYLQFHLDPTADRGGLRLSADAATQLTVPQMYVGRSDFSEIGDVHYGVGFEVAHYRGERLIVHGGAWSGYTCDLRMLPDRGFGVVVLTNGHWHSGCSVISHAILDRLLGLDPLSWFDRLSGPSAACPRERLRPHHGGTFTLPDDNYFRLEFRRDGSGTVDAMLFHEATGIYLVERVLTPDQDVDPSRLPA
jgi:CubicO group peptidase (beta-lactamase class C family)